MNDKKHYFTQQPVLLTLFPDDLKYIIETHLLSGSCVVLPNHIEVDSYDDNLILISNSHSFGLGNRRIVNVEAIMNNLPAGVSPRDYLLKNVRLYINS